MQFVNPENSSGAQDPSLFLEAVDAWNALLTSQSIRPLFKTEKKKNTGKQFERNQKLMQAQWKIFEGTVETLGVITSSKLPQEKQTEFEAVISAFLLDITATKGPSIAPQQPVLPTIPVLDSRAALMIFLISLVLPNTPRIL